jgi:septal ring factor EnvC (AmiA/AmiB activator)
MTAARSTPSVVARRCLRAAAPAIVAACLVSVAVVAVAADKAAGFGKAKPGTPLLNREQLRACFAQQAEMRTRGDDLAKLQAELDAEKAEIGRLDAARAERLAALDRTSAEAVNAYNLQAQALDQRIDAYNARTPDFNARGQALQAVREAFSRQCENRSYDEKDEDAIKAGK